MLLLPLCPAQAQSTEGVQLTKVVISLGGDPDAIAVADIKHDGVLDIVVANPNSGTVTVLLGDGKGNFQKATGSPFSAAHLPNDVAIAISTATAIRTC